MSLKNYHITSHSTGFPSHARVPAQNFSNFEPTYVMPCACSFQMNVEKGSEYILWLAHTGPRVWDGHPLGGCGSGFGLVPGYTILSVRVRAKINSVPLKAPRLLMPDQHWQGGKDDSRDTSTFLTSCPIGIFLPADSSCEGRVSLHFMQCVCCFVLLSRSCRGS